jgi:hypothetical protein
MRKHSRLQSAAIAGVISAAVAFNSPAGHSVYHEIGLRIHFMPAWSLAEKIMGSMSFQEFRYGAEIFLMMYHDNDADKMLADIKLLNSVSPFCVPFEDTDNDQENLPPIMACHAVRPCASHEGSKKKGLPHTSLVMG